MTTPSSTFLYDTVIDNNTEVLVLHTYYPFVVYVTYVINIRYIQQTVKHLLVTELVHQICTVVGKGIFISLVGAT